MKTRMLNYTVRFAAVCCLCTQATAAPKPSPESVKELTQKVADWQLKTFDQHEQHRALSSQHKAHLEKTGRTLKPYHDLEWQMGALYAGMDQWRTIADKPGKYKAFLKGIGDRNDWKLHKRPYHADDHTVGQFYLSLYQDIENDAMLAPTQDHFDWILANRKTGSLVWCGYNRPYTTDCHTRWGWCDALFMAPPVWARLAKITGDRKYLTFMDEEYHATYNLLWDKEDNFFWRDSSYFTKRESNGKKLYWARGSGWVFGGRGKK